MGSKVWDCCRFRALTENLSSESSWTEEHWGDHWSWWGQADGNHCALPASQFVKAVVHKASLQVSQSSSFAPVSAPLGCDLLTSGFPLAEPSGSSSWEHGPHDRGRPSLSCTTHLILMHLIFYRSSPQKGPGVGLSQGLWLYLSCTKRRLSWACPPAPPAPGPLRS